MTQSLDDGRVSFGASHDENPHRSATDPVCGMSVRVADAVAATENGGRMYFFCSRVCKDEFDNDPERYVADDATAEDDRRDGDDDRRDAATFDWDGPTLRE